MVMGTRDRDHVRALRDGHLEREYSHPSCGSVQQHPLSLGEGKATDDHFIGRSRRKWQRSSLHMREDVRLACNEGRIYHMILCVGASGIVQKVHHIEDLVPWSKERDAWTDNVNHA